MDIQMAGGVVDELKIGSENRFLNNSLVDWTRHANFPLNKNECLIVYFVCVNSPFVFQDSGSIDVADLFTDRIQSPPPLLIGT